MDDDEPLDDVRLNFVSIVARAAGSACPASSAVSASMPGRTKFSSLAARVGRKGRKDTRGRGGGSDSTCAGHPNGESERCLALLASPLSPFPRTGFALLLSLSDAEDAARWKTTGGLGVLDDDEPLDDVRLNSVSIHPNGESVSAEAARRKTPTARELGCGLAAVAVR